MLSKVPHKTKKPSVEYRKKSQKVDFVTDLRADSASIERDAAILGNLRHAVRRKIANPEWRRGPAVQPSLYAKFRGKPFPLRQATGRKLPKWRDLTPWMKAQIGTLVLAEQGWMPFKLHVHDDLWDEWEARGKEPRDELRNRISKHLKDRFGESAPPFFFVLEEHTTTGEVTRPHAHGSVGIARAPLPETGKGSRSLPKLAAKEGIEVAQIEAGRELIRNALGVASGKKLGVIGRSGLNQSRNVWTSRKPYHALFNHQYVDYAFRNTVRYSPRIGEKRFAMVNPLRQEAKRLWTLIRQGESALRHR